ncbi:MAG: D-alanine--D-alanine ligase [Ignavibacteriaceae bacterium]
MKQQARILVCYNSPVSIFPIYTGKPHDQLYGFNDLSEKSFSNGIKKIEHSLLKYFQEVKTFGVDRNINKLISSVRNYQPDVVFNFVESVEGISNYEYCLAGIYELLGVQYTGNTPMCLGNCLNKARTKYILRSFGINTPAFFTLNYGKKTNYKTNKIKFPVIVKLINEDASIGISEFSVVNNYKELKKQAEFLFHTYKQDLIVEEYIEGRELNVAILGGKTLPISEISFIGLPDALPKIVTYEGKWFEESIYYENTKPVCPAKLDRKTKSLVEKTALAAYTVMSARDYARVDIRLNKEKIPYVIEVNPNPDISIDSGFARAASAAGISHENLLYTIANFALNRKGNDSQLKTG